MKAKGSVVGRGKKRGMLSITGCRTAPIADCPQVLDLGRLLVRMAYQFSRKGCFKCGNRMSPALSPTGRI